MKNIDIDKYPYNKTTVKKIKLIFRNLFDNRKKYISENQALTKKDMYNFLTTENTNNTNNAKYNVSEKKNNYLKNKNSVYYNDLRNKIINQYRNEITFKPENLSQTYNHSYLTEKRRKLKMEDAYQYQKRKREK
jgi:hypothetical protein